VASKGTWRCTVGVVGFIYGSWPRGYSDAVRRRLMKAAVVTDAGPVHEWVRGRQKVRAAGAGQAANR
jgi:hypothetical protein